MRSSLRDEEPPVEEPRARRKARAWPWLLALAVALGLAARLIAPAPATTPPTTGATMPPAPAIGIDEPMRPAQTTAAPPLAGAAPADCAIGPAAAAQSNSDSLNALAWAPFRGRPETGWETYAPLVAAEIGTACAPTSPAFAAALARWQGGRRLAATGVFNAETFRAMNSAWSLARPFVLASRNGACPPPPAADQLVALPSSDSYGKPERLTPQTLAAYRRMVADARAAEPAIAADPKMLTVFSAYRDPIADAIDCAARGNCGGPEKANCSAHRSGTALDIVVGAAPGQRVDSTADDNRLAMSKTPAYRWLVLNAPRYGFRNYAFEPWHWEWIGEPAP